MNTQTTLKQRLQNPLVQARKQRLSQLGNIEHRLEYVDTYEGVEYINDAKASDANSTWYSLDCMEKPVVWIMSSSEFEEDLALFYEMDTENVKALIILGTAKTRMEEIFEHKIELVGKVNTVYEAVEHAHLIANQGDVVLFSPACSDFDTYRSYRDCGQQFRKAVREIQLAL